MRFYIKFDNLESIGTDATYTRTSLINVTYINTIDLNLNKSWAKNLSRLLIFDNSIVW